MAAVSLFCPARRKEAIYTDTSSFALFFTTSPCWAYWPSLATHRALRRFSLAGIYGWERTDWLSSMEHLRTWAHTATLCRYSGLRSPRGFGPRDHGAARWYWDGMVRGRGLDIHWGCYGLVPLGIGRSVVGCMPTHVYT